MSTTYLLSVEQQLPQHFYELLQQTSQDRLKTNAPSHNVMFAYHLLEDTKYYVYYYSDVR